MPLIPTNLSEAIDKTLNESGIPELSSDKELLQLLRNKGVNLDTLATELANLLQTGKANVRHKVTMDLLALHGIDFRQQQSTGIAISVNFQNEEGAPTNVQLNNMFMPKR